MRDYSNLEEYTDKRLRTLRNNLNNRIGAIQSGSPKSLGQNHPLYGLELSDCKDLLEKVLNELKKRV